MYYAFDTTLKMRRVDIFRVASARTFPIYLNNFISLHIRLIKHYSLICIYFHLIHTIDKLLIIKYIENAQISDREKVVHQRQVGRQNYPQIKIKK